MRYTVICYRPDGVDTCMGCTMETSSSEFEIHVEKSVDAAGLRMAEKQFKNQDENRGLAVQDWELTLLIDGAEHDHDDPAAEEARDLVDAAAHTHLQRLISEAEERKRAEQERLERTAAEALREKNAAKERHERAEFERLRQKYGDKDVLGAGKVRP